MKYTVELLLWHHEENASKESPIYIKITINRQTRYISTGHYVLAKLWDPKAKMVKESHPDASIWNPDITNRRQMIMRAIVERHLRNEAVTASQIKQMFAGGRSLNNFFDFTTLFISEMKHKRQQSTLENYRKHTKKLELFHGSHELTFEEINHDYLTRYESYLRESVKENYINALWKTYKTIFNQAIKRGIVRDYPFSTYENPKYEAPGKEYLTLPEMDGLEKLADNSTDPTVKQSCIYFLLGCYSGLRVSDWYKFDHKKNIKDGRLYLRATKNNEWVTMPLSMRLKRTLRRIEKTKLTIVEQEINRTLQNIAEDLKLNKHLTTHCARHSFAITICAERGISCETCAELMGITVKTCSENYYKVTNRKIDKETLKAWRGL